MTMATTTSTSSNITLHRRKNNNNTTSSWSSRTVRDSTMAGYIAGATGTLVGYPMDSIKVWLQTASSSKGNVGILSVNTFSSTSSSGGSSSSSRTSHGIGQQQYKSSTGNSSTVNKSTTYRQSSTLASVLSLNETNNVISNETRSIISARMNQMKSLYAGVSAPLVTVGMIQSINFAIYDSTRRYLYKGNGCYLNDDTLSSVALASGISGMIISFVTNPLLMIKTQQQSSAAHGQKLLYRQAVFRLLTWNNYAKSPIYAVRNFYIGFIPHAITEVGGRAIYFVSYEGMKRTLAHMNERNTSTIPERMISASISGIITWCIIYPLDVMRCKMYTSKERSIINMTNNMYTNGNIYRGLSITLLRAGPVAAFVLPIYDIILDKLSNLP